MCFRSHFMCSMSGQDSGYSLFKRLPKCIKELPVAGEGTKPGVAELQAFAHEESMNFFSALLSPSRGGVFLGMV